MVQLSIINPHTIFTTFARLKFFYVKCPFIGDFCTYDIFHENILEGTVVLLSYWR